MDSHYRWRTVARNCKDLESKAPDGYKPVVEAFIAGRLDAVRVEFVETSREPGNPWTWLQAIGPKGAPPGASTALVGAMSLRGRRALAEWLRVDQRYVYERAGVIIASTLWQAQPRSRVS